MNKYHLFDYWSKYQGTYESKVDLMEPLLSVEDAAKEAERLFGDRLQTQYLGGISEVVLSNNSDSYASLINSQGELVGGIRKVMPVIIDGPGKYRTRCGLIAVIFDIRPVVTDVSNPTTHFNCKGEILRKTRSGRIEGSFNTWTESGSNSGSKSPYDIVEKFQDSFGDSNES